ncbi:MAG: cation diffusion facilitator family transporter [Planctomycetes bacterium]|nr:cation diffusion facilitator family transporter [Planctomycetota bacterium]
MEQKSANGRGAKRERAITSITVIGAIVNVILTIGKMIVGVIAGSAAMIADAVHSLSDLATDFVTLLGIRIASKPRDDDHPYGHGRFETLSAMVLAIILLVTAAGIVYSAIGRFDTTEVPGGIAVIAAAVSIVSKELLFQYTLRAGKKHQSDLVIANAWHHRSDAVSSIAALLGIVGAMSGFPILDPVAAVIVAVLIAKVAVQILANVTREITDTLDEKTAGEIREGVSRITGVVALHELRVRKLGPDTLVDLHVEVEGSTTVSDGHQVAERVRKWVTESFLSVRDVLVHIDPEPDVEEVDTIRLWKSREEIESEARAVAAEISESLRIVRILPHYLGRRVSVQVHVELGPELTIRESNEIAIKLRERLEGINGVDNADILLNLDDRGSQRLLKNIASLGPVDSGEN